MIHPWVLLLAVFCSLQGAGLGWLFASRGLRRSRRRASLASRALQSAAARADLLALNAAITASQSGPGAKGLDAIATGMKELAAELRAASSAASSSGAESANG